VFFDPVYFLFLAPGILLGLYAQWKVMSAYHRGSRIPARSGVSGAETAAVILRHAGVRGVQIEDVPGQLTDHYSPAEKTLRLSPGVFEGRSLASLGIAAHEVGHAIQDANRYPLLVVRNAIVPLANFGGSIGIILIVLGFVLANAGLGWLIYAGIAVFSLTVLFQVVNLPVEFDASRRARKLLLSTGLVTREEEPEVGRVLNAAALTYVAATITSILTLLYFLFRAGAPGRSSSDE
jgi:Zn-dependent membrane protease YugP